MKDYTFIFIVINTILLLRILRSRKIHPLLKIFWGVSYFGWNAFPAIIMYTPELAGSTIIGNESYVFSSYVNQIFLFVSYLLGYIMIHKIKTPRFIERYDFQDNSKLFDFSVNFALICLVYIMYNNLTSSISYIERNDVDNAHAISPLRFISSFMVTYLIGVVLLCKERLSFSKYNLCIAMIAVHLLIQTFLGGRIYIFGIVIIFLHYAIEQKRKTSFIVGVIVGLFALTLLPSISSLRGQGDFSASEAITSSRSTTGTQIIGEIFVKTNSVLYGSYLLEKDGVGKWDGKMYSSTIYALIPRFLYPNKPEPGSVDGTPFGLPARASVDYSTIGVYDGIGNNGVTASVSSLWGGGWIAYFCEIFSVAFIIFLFNCVFYSKKPLFICFAISLMGFPICVLEVPGPQILTGIQRFIVIYLFIKMIVPTRRVSYGKTQQPVISSDRIS